MRRASSSIKSLEVISEMEEYSPASSARIRVRNAPPQEGGLPTQLDDLTSYRIKYLQYDIRPETRLVIFTECMFSHRSGTLKLPREGRVYRCILLNHLDLKLCEPQACPKLHAGKPQP